MIDNIYALIMAGGPGKRFWPLSRPECPKPFLQLLGKESLLQFCYKRMRKLLPPERIIVIVSKMHKELVAEQLPELPDHNCVGEAEGRDSAACIGLGSAIIANRDKNGIMVAVPADQIISPAEEFLNAIKALSEAVVSESCIGTIGITPFEPAVRFGYIHMGEPVGIFGNHTIFDVLSFKEKPIRKVAVDYYKSGQYLWNAGIFIAPVKILQEEIKKHFPPLGEALNAFKKLFERGIDPTEVTAEVYSSIPRQSIDYAVIEKLEKVIAIKASFKWDDMGDWRSLKRHVSTDSDENIILGQHVGIDSKKNILYSDELLVATLGLEDIVVVQNGKLLLVASSDKLDKLKDLVNKVEKSSKKV